MNCSSDRLAINISIKHIHNFNNDKGVVNILNYDKSSQYFLSSSDQIEVKINSPFIDNLEHGVYVLKMINVQMSDNQMVDNQVFDNQVFDNQMVDNQMFDTMIPNTKMITRCFEIKKPDQLIVRIVSLPNESKGTIYLKSIAFGGSGDYTYCWIVDSNNPKYHADGDLLEINETKSGSYEYKVLVTDSWKNYVMESTMIKINPLPNVMIDHMDINKYGDLTGLIRIIPKSDVDPNDLPYTYTVQTVEGSNYSHNIEYNEKTSEFIMSNLPADNYLITIKNKSNRSVVINQKITQPPELHVKIIGKQHLSNNQSIPYILWGFAYGGVGNPEDIKYMFTTTTYHPMDEKIQYFTNGIYPHIEVTVPGIYKLHCMDLNGCRITDQIIIHEQPSTKIQNILPSIGQSFDTTINQTINSLGLRAKPIITKKMIALQEENDKLIEQKKIAKLK